MQSCSESCSRMQNDERNPVFTTKLGSHNSKLKLFGDDRRQGEIPVYSCWSLIAFRAKWHENKIYKPTQIASEDHPDQCSEMTYFAHDFPQVLSLASLRQQHRSSNIEVSRQHCNQWGSIHESKRATPQYLHKSGSMWFAKSNLFTNLESNWQMVWHLMLSKWCGCELFLASD